MATPWDEPKSSWEKYRLNQNLVAYWCLVVFVLSCSRKCDKPLISHPAIVAISNYYGESYDTVKKYYQFTDSIEVKTIHVLFYHFYDMRDTLDNKNFWGEGVVALNRMTNNFFIYSSRIKGKMVVVPSLLVKQKRVHHVAWKTDESFLLYEDTFRRNKHNCGSLDVFTNRNSGISMKLSAILNDIPPSVKARMTRSVMDSLIKYFLFKNLSPTYYKTEEYIKPADSNGIASLYHYLNDGHGSSLKFLFYKRLQRQNSVLNSYKGQLEYLKNMLLSVKDKNRFIYIDRCDLLFNDMLIMVVINDGLSENLNHQDYYSVFNKEPIMYDVKIYSENL